MYSAKSMGHDPDADLLEQAGMGNQRAAQQLLARRLPSLLALAERILNDRTEAEDVVQETFERIWKKAGQWKKNAKLSTYMYKIALNLCYDRLRKKGRFCSFDETTTVPAHENSDWYAVKAVRTALANLPERQRTAILLSHYEGLSNSEAATVLGIGVPALESLLARGRKRLKRLLLHQDMEWEKV